MSEPTIYKPSIYNGPTVYNNGAAGGGGGGEELIYKYDTDFSNFDINTLTDYSLDGQTAKFLSSGSGILQIDNGLKFEPGSVKLWLDNTHIFSDYVKKAKRIIYREKINVNQYGSWGNAYGFYSFLTAINTWNNTRGHGFWFVKETGKTLTTSFSTESISDNHLTLYREAYVPYPGALYLNQDVELELEWNGDIGEITYKFNGVECAVEKTIYLNETGDFFTATKGADSFELFYFQNERTGVTVKRATLEIYSW